MTTKSVPKLVLFIFLTISYLKIVHVIEARNFKITTMTEDHDGAGNLMDCWNGALELKSCTDEIIDFFINRSGTTEPGISNGIDKDCCRAIELVVKECWSVMFTSLGLMTMQVNNLREYCDFDQTEKKLELSPSPAPETLALSPVEITFPGY